MPFDCRAILGERTRRLRCIVLVFVKAVLATLAGYFIGCGQTYLAVALNLLVFVPLYGFCRTARIEFGLSGLLWSQLFAHLVACLFVLTVVGIPFAFTFEVFPSRLASAIVGLVTAVTSGVSVAFLGGPPIYLSGALAVAFRGLYGVALPISKVPGYMPLYGWTLATWSVITAFVRYQKDQSALGLLGIVISNVIPYGYALAGNEGDAWLSLAIALILAYLQLLWMRRGRQFPPGLRDCKYVTLDYLRKIAASGEGIRRCQDLPPEAFGHPRKARYVISVSHRWLDRYTCDVRTDEFPEGTRLRTMVATLDMHFSLKGLFRGHGFWNRLQRLSMALTGGRDVVLFFDYMSLPQESRDADGRICPRSIAEQQIFSRCLPNMGALYSMLPVLVCEEVPRGTRSFLESGWCFAEVSTAWLGNQLERYSSKSHATTWFNRMSQRNAQPGYLANDLDEELQNKYFLREDDRAEVRQIIRGFLTKSLLINALKNRSTKDLAEVLSSETLKHRGLLDQAIDSELNTPLHLAVALNFVEGVRQLLDAGALKELRNHRGDKPVECWMLPRLSKAARVCRTYRSKARTEAKAAARAARFSVTTATATAAAETIRSLTTLSGLKAGQIEAKGANLYSNGKSSEFAAIFQFFREQPTDKTMDVDEEEGHGSRVLGRDSSDFSDESGSPDARYKGLDLFRDIAMQLTEVRQHQQQQHRQERQEQEENRLQQRQQQQQQQEEEEEQAHPQEPSVAAGIGPICRGFGGQDGMDPPPQPDDLERGIGLEGATDLQVDSATKIRPTVSL